MSALTQPLSAGDLALTSGRSTNVLMEIDMDAQRELPKYQCHKQVWALRIAGVEIKQDGSAVIAPQDEGYAAFTTQPGWSDRFKGDEDDPGVYVLYEGGYESWSPTKAFDDGYSLAD